MARLCAIIIFTTISKSRTLANRIVNFIQSSRSYGFWNFRKSCSLFGSICAKG